MGETTTASERPVRRKVRLKHPSYQPSKRELEEEIRVPDGMTAEDVLRGVLQPTDIEFENPSR